MNDSITGGRCSVDAGGRPIALDITARAQRNSLFRAAAVKIAAGRGGYSDNPPSSGQTKRGGMCDGLFQRSGPGTGIGIAASGIPLPCRQRQEKQNEIEAAGACAPAVLLCSAESIETPSAIVRGLGPWALFSETAYEKAAHLGGFYKASA